MEFLGYTLIAFLAGIMASMGLGGGMPLILYLTIFLNENQIVAQGTNIIFFIPIGILSVILHSRKKLIKWKSVILPLIFGALSVCLCAYFASKANVWLIQKAFAVFIITVGIITFFKKQKKSSEKNSPKP